MKRRLRLNEDRRRNKGRNACPPTSCPSVQDEISRLVEGGYPPETACDEVGIAHSSFWRWMKLGSAFLSDEAAEEDLEVYGAFALAVRKARARFLGRMIREALCTDADPKKWRRALEILQRRDQPNWSTKTPDSRSEDDVYSPDDAFL